MSSALARRYACPVCRRGITPSPATTTVSQHVDGIGKPCPMTGEPIPFELYRAAGAA